MADSRHSVEIEELDNGHVVRETHSAGGKYSESKRYIPGKAPGRDGVTITVKAPNGLDGTNSMGLAGAKTALGGSIGNKPNGRY